jgi:hypothetical protein
MNAEQAALREGRTNNLDMKTKDNSDNNKKQEEGPEKEPFENRPLPGEYPPSEDIMNRMNEMERVSIDPDNLTPASGPSSTLREDLESDSPFPEERPTHKATRGPSDLTKEDFEALGPRDLSMDGGDDEMLKQRTWPVDFSASDLDVPSGETDKPDAMEQGDEENDHYSLGGDSHDSLEDDPTRTFG